jgi:hypothetical protein
MPTIASRDVRYVHFSWFYHATMRNIIAAVDADQKPEVGHDYDHRVAAVVILAALVIEATVNEMADWLRKHFTTPVAMPDDFFDQGYSLWKRWRVLPNRCRIPGFNERAAPWLDFAALITLRNSIVHPLPYSPPPEDSVLERLEAVGCVRPATDWFESVMTVRTAKWANRVASAMPEAVSENLKAAGFDLHNGGASWLWGPDHLPSWP